MDGAQKFIACIEQNRHLLKNRPQCFQHGDYHIGNMMIENGKLVVIDLTAMILATLGKSLTALFGVHSGAPICVRHG